MIDDKPCATQGVEEVYQSRCLSRMRRGTSFLSQGSFDGGLIMEGE